jgi:hypothetical protein
MPRITVGSLNAIETVRHAFFTRLGGVSAGVYASNNCGFGSKDKPDAVAENRARAAARLVVAPDRIVTSSRSRRRGGGRIRRAPMRSSRDDRESDSAF